MLLLILLLLLLQRNAPLAAAVESCREDDISTEGLAVVSAVMDV